MSVLQRLKEQRDERLRRAGTSAIDIAVGNVQAAAGVPNPRSPFKVSQVSSRHLAFQVAGSGENVSASALSAGEPTIMFTPSKMQQKFVYDSTVKLDDSFPEKYRSPQRFASGRVAVTSGQSARVGECAPPSVDGSLASGSECTKEKGDESWRPTLLPGSRITTEPPLDSVTYEQAKHLVGFVVRDDDVGMIRFLDPVDIRGVCIDSVISFSEKSIDMYPVTAPPPYTELNVNTELTFFHIKCPSRTSMESFVEKLRQYARKMNATFCEYDSIGEKVVMRSKPIQ